MIQLRDIGKSFSGEYLFRNVQWTVKDSDRIGLVGDNGTGKSTLMKIIAGIVPCEEGEVSAPKGTTFGYLPQSGLTLRGNTVFQEVKSVFIDLIDLQHEMSTLEMKMNEVPHDDKEYTRILHRYDEVIMEFSTLGGYTMEKEIGRVLDGLGFKKNDWERDTGEFSGGWQMRIALAKLLLKKPTILLLDEPTNHLDLIARNWLEDYLTEYPGTVIVVSHDRYFLDIVVNRITALAFRKLHDYYTNYSGYIVQHDNVVSRQIKEHNEQKNQIEKLKRFINRYRCDKKRTGQVHSREKMLKKLEQEPVESPKHAKTVKFRLPLPPRSGLKVLELMDVGKSYGTNKVFDSIKVQIQRGDRIALVGENGAGKSTLMRIFAGKEPVSSGERILGSNVAFACFDQDHAEKMGHTNNVLAELESVAPSELFPQLRNILGAFLFTGDDIEKPVSVLSGGELSRLTIAKMLLRPNNLLLLDEPTNHLDMKAKEVLLEALKDFKGTIVFVSHDRYFIDELAEKIIDVGRGGIKIYSGNYEDYQYYKSRQEGPSSGTEPEKRPDSQKKGPSGTVEERKTVSKNYLRKIKDIENLIAGKEVKIQEYEEKMARPGFYDNEADVAKTVSEYKTLKKEVSKLYSRWEKMHEETS